MRLLAMRNLVAMDPAMLDALQYHYCGTPAGHRAVADIMASSAQSDYC